MARGRSAKQLRALRKKFKLGEFKPGRKRKKSRVGNRGDGRRVRRSSTVKRSTVLDSDGHWVFGW